jgi:hypothetical protein
MGPFAAAHGLEAVRRRIIAHCGQFAAECDEGSVTSRERATIRPPALVRHRTVGFVFPRCLGDGSVAGFAGQFIGGVHDAGLRGRRVGELESGRCGAFGEQPLALAEQSVLVDQIGALEGPDQVVSSFP